MIKKTALDATSNVTGLINAIKPRDISRTVRARLTEALGEMDHYDLMSRTYAPGDQPNPIVIAKAKTIPENLPQTIETIGGTRMRKSVRRALAAAIQEYRTNKHNASMDKTRLDHGETHNSAEQVLAKRVKEILRK
ncbi:MAG: hypothetical protein V2A63_02380 [Patescibacteria group bacterium]